MSEQEEAPVPQRKKIDLVNKVRSALGGKQQNEATDPLQVLDAIETGHDQETLSLTNTINQSVDTRRQNTERRLRIGYGMSGSMAAAGLGLIVAGAVTKDTSLVEAGALALPLGGVLGFMNISVGRLHNASEQIRAINEVGQKPPTEK